MMRNSIQAFLLSVALSGTSVLAQTTKPQPAWHDTSPHRVQFVSVEKNVHLEVLDWGGSGRPVVLLTGLGNTAHVYDDFAPKLTKSFHVYGITRRGFGASSTPKSGYSADRLGDDVLAVLDSLKIERSVLVGHSIAGEELSSIATRHPERVAGLVYLEAAHEYAFYDAQHGAYLLDSKALREQLDVMQKDPYDVKQMQALAADISILQRSLHVALTQIQGDVGHSSGPTKADQASFAAMRKFVAGQLGGMIPESELRQTFEATATGGVGTQRTPSFVYDAILNGEQKYTSVHVPILDIVAVPKDHGKYVSGDSTTLAAAESRETALIEMQIDAVRKAVPSAKIVRIAHANHYVFLSNEAEVLQRMSAFIKSLP